MLNVGDWQARDVSYQKQAGLGCLMWETGRPGIHLVREISRPGMLAVRDAGRLEVLSTCDRPDGFALPGSRSAGDAHYERQIGCKC
jgi:hypothetical protein